MTLKEKFYKESIEKPYIFPLDEYEQIADEFAIGFAYWCVSKDKLDLVHDLVLIGELNRNYTTKELLEIYKKEKGL